MICMIQTWYKMTPFPFQFMVNLIFLLECFSSGPHKRGVLSKHTASGIYNGLQSLRLETLGQHSCWEMPGGIHFGTVETT